MSEMPSITHDIGRGRNRSLRGRGPERDSRRRSKSSAKSMSRGRWEDYDIRHDDRQKYSRRPDLDSRGRGGPRERYRYEEDKSRRRSMSRRRDNGRRCCDDYRENKPQYIEEIEKYAEYGFYWSYDNCEEFKDFINYINSHINEYINEYGASYFKTILNKLSMALNNIKRKLDSMCGIQEKQNIVQQLIDNNSLLNIINTLFEKTLGIQYEKKTKDFSLILNFLANVIRINDKNKTIIVREINKTTLLDAVLYILVSDNTQDISNALNFLARSDFTMDGNGLETYFGYRNIDRKAEFQNNLLEGTLRVLERSDPQHISNTLNFLARSDFIMDGNGFETYFGYRNIDKKAKFQNNLFRGTLIVFKNGNIQDISNTLNFLARSDFTMDDKGFINHFGNKYKEKINFQDTLFRSILRVLESGNAQGISNTLNFLVRSSFTMNDYGPENYFGNTDIDTSFQNNLFEGILRTLESDNPQHISNALNFLARSGFIMDGGGLKNYFKNISMDRTKFQNSLLEGILRVLERSNSQHISNTLNFLARSGFTMDGDGLKNYFKNISMDRTKFQNNLFKDIIRVLECGNTQAILDIINFLVRSGFTMNSDGFRNYFGYENIDRKAELQNNLLKGTLRVLENGNTQDISNTLNFLVRSGFTVSKFYNYFGRIDTVEKFQNNLFRGILGVLENGNTQDISNTLNFLARSGFIMNSYEFRNHFGNKDKKKMIDFQYTLFRSTLKVLESDNTQDILDTLNFLARSGFTTNHIGFRNYFGYKSIYVTEFRIRFQNNLFKCTSRVLESDNTQDILDTLNFLAISGFTMNDDGFRNYFGYGNIYKKAEFQNNLFRGISIVLKSYNSQYISNTICTIVNMIFFDEGVNEQFKTTILPHIQSPFDNSLSKRLDDAGENVDKLIEQYCSFSRF